MAHRDAREKAIIRRIDRISCIVLAFVAFVMLFVAIGMLVSFLADLAAAQDPGEYYHSLQRPDGMNCYGGNDCAALGPGEFRETEHGYEVLYKGEWLGVMPMAILPDAVSWDGRNHACIGDYSASGGDVYVRCLIVDIRS